MSSGWIKLEKSVESHPRRRPSSTSVARPGDVHLQAGGNQRRLVPPEPWKMRNRHLQCGIGGVVS